MSSEQSIAHPNAYSSTAGRASRHPGPENLERSAGCLQSMTIIQVMVRPGSWSRPAGESPVRVDTGVPGSRPRFVVERRRAKRGVRSLFGGSEHAGRSVKRTLQPRQIYNGGAEPLMSRRRPCPAGLVPVMTWRVLLERGMGKRAARGTAPLTTNDDDFASGC